MSLSTPPLLHPCDDFPYTWDDIELPTLDFTPPPTYPFDTLLCRHSPRAKDMLRHHRPALTYATPKEMNRALQVFPNRPVGTRIELVNEIITHPLWGRLHHSMGIVRLKSHWQATDSLFFPDYEGDAAPFGLASP